MLRVLLAQKKSGSAVEDLQGMTDKLGWLLWTTCVASGREGSRQQSRDGSIFVDHDLLQRRVGLHLRNARENVTFR